VGQYSIKDIEKLTGIKAHTIRIWEQRYGLVEPHRTDTNIRYYDDNQLKTWLNLFLRCCYFFLGLPIPLSAIRHLPAGTATTAAVAYYRSASSP
jgi:DNA-binding transcriptional MerR regulator